MERVQRSIILALLVGFIVGVVWLLGVRVLMAKNTAPHYHANFAVYVDGQPLKFEGPTFYEEVTSCSEGSHQDPKHRVHMHNNVSHVVHVHSDAVTWGAFFANLRYGLTDKTMELDDQILVDGQGGKQLTFWLNGEAVERVNNRVIESGDALLISYGNSNTATLKDQYNEIPKDADRYNQLPDPNACSGGQELGLVERLKRAFTVNQTD